MPKQPRTKESISPDAAEDRALHSRTSSAPDAGKPPVAVCVILILIAWALLFTIRVTAPPTLMDDDQERPLAYTLDAVVNGNWIVQRDDRHDITSKPPFVTWIGALAMTITGHKGLMVPYLMNGLATLGTLLLVFFGTRRLLGNLTALVAAIVLQYSMMGARQLLLIRTDSVFTLLVVAGAIAAISAINGRSSWIWFWVLVTMSSLTKGPLGLLLSLLVVPGAIMATLSVGKRPRFPLVPNLIGFGLFLGVGLLWFFSAWMVAGQDLIDKMIGRELVGHALKKEGGGKLWNPPLYLLLQFAPWSLFAFIGVVRIWFAERGSAARAALFPAASAMVGGLVIFGLGAHQRPLHVMPLVPAAAVLAAWVLVSMFRIRATRRWALAYLLMLVVAGSAFTVYYHVIRRHDVWVGRTIAAAEFEDALRERGINPNDLTFVDAHYTTQYFLGRMQPRADADLARKALEAPEPFLAVVRGTDSPLLGAGQELLSWPPENEPTRGFLGGLTDRILGKTTPGFTKVIGNNQTRPGRRVIYPPHSITITNGRIIDIRQGYIEVAPTGNLPPTVSVKSHVDRDTRYTLRTPRGGQTTITLTPGERKTITPTRF